MSNARQKGVHLSDAEMQRVIGAERSASGMPMPTQIISNGEFNPLPQTELVGREHRKRLVTEAPAIESARLIHENEAILPEIAPGRDVNTQCSGGRMCSSR